MWYIIYEDEEVHVVKVILMWNLIVLFVNFEHKVGVLGLQMRLFDKEVKLKINCCV